MTIEAQVSVLAEEAGSQYRAIVEAIAFHPHTRPRRTGQMTSFFRGQWQVIVSFRPHLKPYRALFIDRAAQIATGRSR
jgi:hypothetical protein